MRTTISCAGCDREVAGPTARWCGHCGHPLDRPDDDRRPTGPASHVAPLPHDTADDDTVEDEVRAPVSRRSRVVGAAVVTVVLGGLLAAQASRQAPEEPHGYTDRGVPARTGVVSASGIEPPESVAWSTALELPGFTPGGATVHGTGELVYVVDLQGQQGVTAHDATSGAVRWSRPDLPLSESAPLTVADTLVVGTRDGARVALGPDGTTRWTLPDAPPNLVPAGGGLAEVHGTQAVVLRDAATGQQRWRFPLAEALDASAQYVLAGGPDDVVVVLASRPRGLTLGSNPELESGHLVALEADTGELRWEIDLPSALAWFQSPVAIDQEVAVAANAGEVVFWDLASGRRLAAFDRTLTFAPLWVGAAEGHGLLLEPAGSLTAIRSDGTRRWSLTTTLPATVDVRGDIVLVSTGSRMTALDAGSGEVLGGAPVDRSSRRGAPGADGAVYALGSDGRLTAYEPTGGIRFDQPTLVPPAAAPAVADDALYLSTGTGISVLSADDGARLWEFRNGDPNASVAGDLFAPVVDEEVVIVSPPRSQPLEVGGVFALQRDNGILAWDRLTDRPSPRGPLTFDRDLAVLPVEGEIHGHSPLTGRRALAALANGHRGPVAAAGGLLVAATAAGQPGGEEGPTVVAVRRADRGRVWETPVAACTPPSILDDLVLVGTVSGIRALDLAAGTPRWASAPMTHPVCGELVVGADTVVGVTGGTELVAVRALDGAPAWRTSLPAAVAAAPSLAGDELLVPLLDGSIVAVGLDDGGLRWAAALGGVPASTPVVADGRAVVLLREGRIVALEAG